MVVFWLLLVVVENGGVVVIDGYGVGSLMVVMACDGVCVV
jgi:hypothetical protein